jgi:hypothetical protein
MRDSMSSRRSFLAGSAPMALAGMSKSSWSESHSVAERSAVQFSTAFDIAQGSGRRVKHPS